MWPWNLTDNLDKIIGHLFYAAFKLCAWFDRNRSIQTRVTVQKHPNWSKIFFSSVTLTFDIWPWCFAWTSHLSMVITLENFMMIWWQEHSEKDVTDRRTDRRTDWTIHRAAWSQLKTGNFGTWRVIWQPRFQFSIFSLTSVGFIRFIRCMTSSNLV